MVSRAHYYGVCERDVFVEPLSELHRPGFVAKLNNTMYGTQDSRNMWQKLWCEQLRSNGFELGASNSALYRSELVNGFCHGDDFVTAVAEDQIEIFGKMLQEAPRARGRTTMSLVKNAQPSSHCPLCRHTCPLSCAWCLPVVSRVRCLRSVSCPGFAD